MREGSPPIYRSPLAPAILLLAGAAMWPAWGQGVQSVSGALGGGGPALGPVTNQVQAGAGTVGLVASQSLFFAGAAAAPGHTGADEIGQAAASIDTAGSRLQAAFRMHRGDPPSTLDMDISNRGSGRRSAIVTITRGNGSSINLTEADPDCQLAQFTTAAPPPAQARVDSYLMVVNGSATCTLRLLAQVGTAEPLGASQVGIALAELP